MVGAHPLRACFHVLSWCAERERQQSRSVERGVESDCDFYKIKCDNPELSDYRLAKLMDWTKGRTKQCN